MLFVMLVVVSLVFIIVRLIPGDPAGVMLGSTATPADVAALRTRMGLDAPLLRQYLDFLRAAATLDLGQSIFLNRSVIQAILERAPLTLQLTTLAIGLATLIGVPVGIVAAVRRGTWLDQAVTTACLAAASLPSFWIGMTLIQYIAVQAKLLPVSGYGQPDAGPIEHLRHLVLPAVAIGVPTSAVIARFTRTSMLDALGEDYVRTARAKGLAAYAVVVKHAFGNARTQVLTVVGLAVASVIGGAIVTETVFALPGVGNLIVSAVIRRDYPLIQGALLVISGVYVLINLGVDLLYAVLDPRVRY